MLNQQTIIQILPKDLKEKVREMLAKHYRLGQICCTKTEGYELTYSFTPDNYTLENLRINIDNDTEIESISDLYSFAFIYENEIKDLFGVKIKNINIDFKGDFIKTSIKTPYNPSVIEDTNNESR